MAPDLLKRRRLDSGRQPVSLRDASDSNNLEDVPDRSADAMEVDTPNASRSTQQASVPATSTASSTKSQRAAEDVVATFSRDQATSSIFKMQLDEMLSSLQPNYEQRISSIDTTLKKLKNLIENIRDEDPQPIATATASLKASHSISIPYPSPKPSKDLAYKLSYAKPSAINVVGSYVLKSMTKGDDSFAVDMVVVMPSSVFQEKDHLNYRYFYKRAYYLACVAAGLKDCGPKIMTVSFEYLSGNSLQPVIVITAGTGQKSLLTGTDRIQIILAAPDKVFPPKKLVPMANNVRPKNGGQGDDRSTSLAPTPLYNSSICADLMVLPYLKLLHSSSKRCPAFVQACMLGRVWLRQRGFRGEISNGGFGSFEWSVLLALLLEGGGPKGQSVLSTAYSSFQLFKTTIQFLAETNLATKQLLFRATDQVCPRTESPVFFDGPRNMNVLFKMTPWSYSLLRVEAANTLQALNSQDSSAFDSTFILKVDHALQRYDCMVRFVCPTQVPPTDSTDHIDPITSFSRKAYSVLREGFTDRVKLIYIKLPRPGAWGLGDDAPQSADNRSILVSFVFDPASIDRSVDHGPSVEDKSKSAKYQQFWGEKSELRRFKDGSILESVIWQPGPNALVFRDILKHLSKRHLGIDLGSQFEIVAGATDFDTILPESNVGLTPFRDLAEAFKKFEQDLRSLDGLPLTLRQLSPTCSQLRMTSIDLPLFSPRHPLKTPAEVVLQFEGSGRWPDDITAIQRTKLAFLIRIGTLLEESAQNVSTRVGIENTDKALQNCGFLDVLYPSGAVFRLRIQNDRERTLLERLTQNIIIDGVQREEAIEGLAVQNRLFSQLPLHNQSITAACTRYPLFSPTTRLVKKWFSAHLFSGHITDEFVELLVAHVFLRPQPWQTPSSMMAGFLRTLHFLSRWDWRSDPLLVDFTGEMTAHEVASTSTRLEAWRKLDPHMNRTVLIAASNHDATGTVYTGAKPSKVVATRMTLLARAACKVVRDEDLKLDLAALFVPKTSDFDFIIHLRKVDSTSRTSAKPSMQFVNLQGASNSLMPGLDAVGCFVDELRLLYSASVVFCHDASNNTVIAGVWNPQTGPRSFRAHINHAVHPNANGTAVEIDKRAILSEIARLGGDIVSRIEVLR